MIPLLFSCQQITNKKEEQIAIDTLIIKIGDLHEEPNPRSDSHMFLYDLKGNKITRFYSDSTYTLLIGHNSSVKMNLFKISDNYKIKKVDSIYYITTDPMDSLLVDRIQFGFLTDSTQNVLLYHHKYQDTEDIKQVIETFTYIDTIGFMDLDLRSKNYIDTTKQIK